MVALWNYHGTKFRLHWIDDFWNSESLYEMLYVDTNEVESYEK